MKIDTPYRCDGDGCGTLKQPSNHWLLVSMSHASIVIAGWTDTRADDSNVHHACGDECALKIVGKLLQVLRRQLAKEAAETASH